MGLLNEHIRSNSCIVLALNVFAEVENHTTHAGFLDEEQEEVHQANGGNSSFLAEWPSGIERNALRCARYFTRSRMDRVD